MAVTEQRNPYKGVPQMPELGLDAEIIGYASDAVVNSSKSSDSTFEGLAGLPLLRMLEYGGDADWFWLRKAAGKP